MFHPAPEVKLALHVSMMCGILSLYGLFCPAHAAISLLLVLSTVFILREKK